MAAVTVTALGTLAGAAFARWSRPRTLLGGGEVVQKRPSLLRIALSSTAVSAAALSAAMIGIGGMLTAKVRNPSHDSVDFAPPHSPSVNVWPDPESERIPAAPAERIERSPSELFAAAYTAHRQAQFRTARVLYTEFLRTYPGDPIAPIAAYELGCLNMDVFGDIQTALRDFERARVLDVNGTLKEALLVRLVRANAARGDARALREHCSAYQKLYPFGADARLVEELCELSRPPRAPSHRR